MPRFNVRYVFMIPVDTPTIGDASTAAREKLRQALGQLDQETGYMVEFDVSRLSPSEALFAATSEELGAAAVAEARKERSS